jgi:NAD(P)-dependent dehydrogenase (short-subunit alcohol dehydrogenase family)
MSLVSEGRVVLQFLFPVDASLPRNASIYWRPASLAQGSDTWYADVTQADRNKIVHEQVTFPVEKWIVCAKGGGELLAVYETSDAAFQECSITSVSKEAAAGTKPVQVQPEATATTTGAAAPLVGLRVKISGLSGRPELNGQHGVAVSFSEASGRYSVSLSGGEVVALKSTNIEPSSDASTATPSPAAEGPSQSTSAARSPAPLSQPGFDVSGGHFVITGGTQGLGLEIARQLKARGAAKLALCARDAAKGAAAVERLLAAEPGGVSPTKATVACEVHFVQTDLGDPEGPSAAITAAIAALGHIDGLVNAAASTSRGNLQSTTAAEWDAMFAVNARAPFLLTQAVSRHMMERGIRGSVVNITSIAGKGGAPFIMAYSASKAAAATLTRNNAAELAPHGIRVNAVDMGWCATDNEDALQRSLNGPDWLAQADAQQPLGRILRPADVAATVGFLLSSASTMMTVPLAERKNAYLLLTY